MCSISFSHLFLEVVILLTSLSWITFIVDPSELSDRCSISLTLLLALNVFQLILSAGVLHVCSGTRSTIVPSMSPPLHPHPSFAFGL
jgi:hypothetical protein